MAALDYGVISGAPQTSGDVPPPEQAPQIPQFNLPPVEVPQTGGSLDLNDLPPAMGAAGSRAGRGDNRIQNIILHSSDGREAGDINTLTQSPNAGAHFYVNRQGQIYPLVNLDDTAFHAGKVSNSAYSNESTIGIEQEHYDPGGPGGKEGEDWPDAQVQATAKLVAALQQRYRLGDNNVLYHSQIAFPTGRKQDPANYPRDKFDQFVAQAKSGTGEFAQTGGQLTIPPIVYPWEAMNPASVTIGDVMQQQQQREAGQIMMFNQTAQPLQVRATHYAYPGEETPDPNSAKGIGAGNRTLGPTSVALSPDVEQSLQANLGDQLVATRADGTQQPVTFDDRTNQNLRGRVDFYDPTGSIGDQGNISIARAGQQPQQFTIPQADYPWQSVSSAVTPEAVQQAVRDSLSRNAFASTERGVPAGYIPPGQQQKVGLVLSQSGDPLARDNPQSFGMRVGTPDDVKAYDQYIASGGDPNAIDPYDKLAVLLARNPKALLDPNNAQLLDEMVVQPQKRVSAQQTLGEKVWNAIGGGVAGLGDAWNAAAALVRNGAKDAIPATRALAEKMTGQTPDPEALAGLTDVMAGNAQAMGKTVSDVYNLVTGIRQAAFSLHVPFASMFTNDPQKLQELHTQYLHDLQTLAADRQQYADLGNGIQSLMANAYSATGMFADLGQKMKTWQVDPQAMEGASQIAQLIAPGVLESLAGMKAAGAFRPLNAERVLEATTGISDARAQKFLFDSTQAVPRDAAAEAANSAYFDVRTAQAALAPDARAANAAFQQENLNLQQQLTRLGRISTDPGTATQFMQGLLNATGGAVANLGKGTEKLIGVGDRILNAASLGSPVLRGLIDKMARVAMFGIGGALHHSPWAARLAEEVIDAAEHVDTIPKAASSLSDFFKTMAQETAYGETSIPYWQRVSQGVKSVSPRMAAFLDLPAVQTIASTVSAGARGAAGGMATGAFIGALGDPDDPVSGAISNMVPGGLFGMVGGGFGQWMRYDNPADVYLRARGDWKRTLDTFSGPQRDQFLSLAPRDQLMLSTYLQQVPGLRVDFMHDPMGPEGYFDPHNHLFDGAGNPTIKINTANPEGTVRGIFGHELMHATQSAGMTTDIYDALLGNVDRGEAGQYTALDAKGNPMGVDPATSRYTTNQEFQNFKNSYIAGMARSGEPTAHLSDLDIARELFAEHGVDHLLSAQGAVDATSAFRPGWINQTMLKNAYAKLGFVFDRQGNMVQGTHLFDNVRPNDEIDKLTQKYFQTRFRDRAFESEELPTRTFTREDLRSTNAADTFLDTAPEIMRNPDGSVMRDARGVPLMRTPAQVRQYNAKLANDMLDRINALPEDRKTDIGLRTLPNGNTFVRYLPQELRDALSKTNEYNPHQIKALNVLSEMLADKTRMGTNFRVFYHKALSEGKRYGSFRGTEKFSVPYGFEISKNDNVLLRSVDFDQLNDNYLKNATRAPFRQLWNNPSEFVTDANTYFQNHARGEPGATGLTEPKRDAINALLRLDTSVNRDANPLLEARGGKGFPSTRPIIKSYRIDRASQVTPLEKTSPFTSEDQYYRMNRNYRPRKGDFVPVSPEDFIEGRNKSTRPEFLSELKPEDLTEHRLFTNRDGTVGYALDPKGDIQNVFNNSGIQGAGANAVVHAISQGGRTLDAFDTFLPRYYRQLGFQETGRMKFNDEFAPTNWNYDKYGRPDVVFMGWGGYPASGGGGPTSAIGRAQSAEINWLPNERSRSYSTDFDRQKDASRAFAARAAADRLSGAGRGTQALAAGGQPGVGPGQAPGTPVDQTAIPVTYRQTRTGSTVEQEIPYGITSAPLVADKQPPANLPADNRFGHIDFLTKPDQQKLTHLDKASAVTDYADKIVNEYDKWKDQGWAAEAKNWYRDVRKYLTKAFGGDKERFAHLLAATSAGQGVIQNWKDALEAYQRYRAGHYDDAIREYKRTGNITEEMKPTKANGTKFGQNSDEVLKVLAGTWLDEVEGPKTPNFFRNLFGRGTDATIDVWAARTMRRLGYEGVEGAPAQWRIQPASEPAVSNLDFAFSQQAFKQAADRLGMKPHELQAIMWYAEKHVWAERGWAKGGAQAAKASYIPRLKEFSEEMTRAGGPESPGYLPRLQRYVQGR